MSVKRYGPKKVIAFSTIMNTYKIVYQAKNSKNQFSYVKFVPPKSTFNVWKIGCRNPSSVTSISKVVSILKLLISKLISPSVNTPTTGS